MYLDSQFQTTSDKGSRRGFKLETQPRYNIGTYNDSQRAAGKYYDDIFTQVDLRASFSRLAKQWKSETSLKSNMAVKAMHPAYQSIIGMGETAIPYILEDMRRGPVADWFWALKFIARHLSPPDTDAIAGQVRKMAGAWIEWGKARGYLNTSQAA